MAFYLLHCFQGHADNNYHSCTAENNINLKENLQKNRQYGNQGREQCSGQVRRLDTCQEIRCRRPGRRRNKSAVFLMSPAILWIKLNCGVKISKKISSTNNIVYTVPPGEKSQPVSGQGMLDKACKRAWHH